MTIGELWLLAGVLLCAAEMLLPGMFLLWIGLAALGTGALTEVTGRGFAWQAVMFVLLFAAGFAAARHRSRRAPHGPDVNAPAAGLIGRSCVAAGFRGAEGRVTIRDGSWPARMAPGAPTGQAADGAVLRVVGLDGNTLLVAPGE